MRRKALCTIGSNLLIQSLAVTVHRAPRRHGLDPGELEMRLGVEVDVATRLGQDVARLHC